MQAHLAMIQGVVNRLAQSSLLLKGWSVVLVSALLAFAAISKYEPVLYVALLPALTFWGLDAYYRWQETPVPGTLRSCQNYGCQVGTPVRLPITGGIARCSLARSGCFTAPS